MYKDGTFVKCFSCGRAADIFTLANWLENKPLDGEGFLTENVFYLADKFGIKYNIVGKSADARTANKYAYLRAYKIVADFIQTTAKENPTDSFEGELKKRRWKKAESIELGLGCVHNFKDILELLEANDFTKEFVELCGLMRSDIFNQDGLIFTVYDEFSRPIAFYMRDTKFEEKKEKWDTVDKLELIRGKAPSKYNSTANYTGVYEKPLFPYGINDVKNFHKIIVVEGHGCKHNLRLHGIDNVIALGGLELGEQTLQKLSYLGVTQVVLLLDNDDKGREKIKNIIRKYYGKTSVDFSVLDMGSVYSDVKDPDEFLRKHGKEKFKGLIEKNSLEWLIGIELTEKSDPYTVLQEITPLIAQERSPLIRMKIVNIIADITGIDRDIINQEVEQKISVSKDRKSEFAIKVMDEAKELLMMNPGALDAAMNLIENKLTLLNKGGNDEELFSGNECLKSLVKLQELEESDDKIPVIKTGYSDWDILCPLPTNEAFVLVMGPPNTGKSSMFINLALRILELNPETMVIIHTIDDSRDVYINRMIATLAQIKINWIKNPKHYLDTAMMKRRHEAYRTIADYMRSDRLIIKDISHGGTVEYHGKLIQHYRDKYPQRSLVGMCDNLHRLDTEVGYEDGRFKTKAISALMKSYTTKYNCVQISTVEMTKQGMYEKPTNASCIAEAASLQFDANLILYLWNDLNVRREAATLTFASTVTDYFPEAGYIHKPTIKPIIECLFLKNKLSEFKEALYFLFHPELAYYDDITIQEVNAIKEERRREEEEKKEKK